MMHALLLTIVIMGVEAVEVKDSVSVSFPGKKVSVNGTSSLTVSKPASSVLDCGMQCLLDGDCVVANYEDAGVCHMLATGPISMEANNQTTAILPESISIAYSHMVGWWPLQEAYGGKDLSGHGNHMELNNITFPHDGVTPWASPAAYFEGTEASYGHIQHGQHLDVKSFSWMAKVYLSSGAPDALEFLFEWLYTGSYGVMSYVIGGQLRTIIFIPGCVETVAVHITSLPYNTWHTVAMTYDFPTNTVTQWKNRESDVTTQPACGTNITTSPELYIGRSSDTGYQEAFHGRLSCMSLFSAVVDYDVMYNATMSRCGGD